MKENKKKKITIRFTEREYEKLKNKFSKFKNGNLSENLRRHLLERPITMHYRNHSMDDFIEELANLRRELNSIGNNFNQAVKKLHTLKMIPEFRNWLATHETNFESIRQQQSKIKEKISQISVQWSQE
jgi:hypothetical protein